ncbi:MAG: hypothetical protein CMF40_05715 [Legionellales bacterium]|nr:hypothetical protein [Legionellales bacterium]
MPLSEIILVIMGLLTISMIAAAICCHIPIPYTVFLVILGMFLGSLARQHNELSFMLDFQLSPDLVLFLFLPVLVFEAAINLDARSMMKDIVPILVLAIPALIISTAIVGLGLWFFQDFNIIYALIFGALISATDPVAVITLFKELGAPSRLTTLIEGESLLNDATAIVLFNILLGISVWQQFGVFDFYVAILEFMKVFFGGLVIGVVMGLITSELLYRIKANISAYLIMSIVLAYSSFSFSEHIMHVSGVMAVVSSAITLGLISVTRIPQKEKETVDETWDVLALVCNSLLFLLIGLSTDVSLLFSHSETIFFSILFVLIARAIGVYSLVPATIRIFNFPKVSMRERHIMWWGALKGGLAIAIVLSIPESMPERETLIYITLGVVIFSLLVNAPSIKILMNKLGFSQLTNEEEIELQHGLKESLKHAKDTLQIFRRASVIPTSTSKLIQEKVSGVFKSTDISPRNHIKNQYAHSVAIRIEMRELKNLYDVGFLQYYTYMNMRVLLQRDKDAFTVKENIDTPIKQNPFIRFESMIIKKLRENNLATFILSQYQYMRFSQSLQRNIAGLLISKKVIDEMKDINDIESQIKKNITKEYRKRLERRKSRLDYIAENYPDFYSRFETRIFEKVSLISANLYIQDAHSSHEVGTKVFSDIKKRIAIAINQLPQITDPVPKLKPKDMMAMVPLLEGLSSKLLEQLSISAKSITFLQGDLIIEQNEKGDSLYIITYGQVTIYKTGHKNDPIAVLGPGDFFGEMALLGEQVRMANVLANKPTTLLRLNKRHVISMASIEPELKNRLERAIKKRKS